MLHISNILCLKWNFGSPTHHFNCSTGCLPMSDSNNSVFLRSSPLTPFSVSSAQKPCLLYTPRIQSLSPSHHHSLGRNHCHSWIRSLQSLQNGLFVHLHAPWPAILNTEGRVTPTTVSQTMSRLLATRHPSDLTFHHPSPLFNSGNRAFLAHARHTPAQDLCTGCHLCIDILQPD